MALEMEKFQKNCLEWGSLVFPCKALGMGHGTVEAIDPTVMHPIERSYRFLEEALELIQATGVTKDEVLKLVDYTYNRPVGDPHAEVGGVMITLSMLCSSLRFDLAGCCWVEMKRVWQKDVMDRIFQKHQNKIHRLPQSPLPGDAQHDEDPSNRFRNSPEQLRNNQAATTAGLKGAGESARSIHSDQEDPPGE